MFSVNKTWQSVQRRFCDGWLMIVSNNGSIFIMFVVLNWNKMIKRCVLLETNKLWITEDDQIYKYITCWKMVRAHDWGILIRYCKSQRKLFKSCNIGSTIFSLHFVVKKKNHARVCPDNDIFINIPKGLATLEAISCFYFLTNLSSKVFLIGNQNSEQ